MIRESHRDASLVDVQSRKHIIVPRDKCLASHRSASFIQWLKFQPLYRLLGTRGEPRHPSYKSQDERRGFDIIDDFPFTLRLSKHSEPFSTTCLVLLLSPFLHPVASTRCSRAL